MLYYALFISFYISALTDLPHPHSPKLRVSLGYKQIYFVNVDNSNQLSKLAEFSSFDTTGYYNIGPIL